MRGPTLGAASLVAAQGLNITQVTGVMLVFEIDAARPLLWIGPASRVLINRNLAEQAAPDWLTRLTTSF